MTEEGLNASGYPWLCATDLTTLSYTSGQLRFEVAMKKAAMWTEEGLKARGCPWLCATGITNLSKPVDN